MLVNDIFKHYNLKKTAARLAVFNFLKQQDSVLPAKLFEKHFALKISRVTIYRVLRDLVKSGLVRSFYNTKGKLFYELSISEDSLFQKSHEHLDCVLCGKIFCLDKATVILENLPKGFEVNRAKICLQGTCSNCHVRLKVSKAKLSLQKDFH